ncbi:MAG: hypothetical protein K8S20_13470 [Chloroflexi bacterium]|nr:hypothetical protein [Chloroflexota bacterium]
MALAGRGSRQLTDKVEEIENPNELKQVRLQALKVLGKSFLVSLVFTLIALALP